MCCGLVVKGFGFKAVCVFVGLELQRAGLLPNVSCFRWCSEMLDLTMPDMCVVSLRLRHEMILAMLCALI